jgi:TPR repeat protein
MRMNSLAQLCFVTCALWLAPALAFDGTRTPANTKPPVTPVEAFRSGAASLKAGENDKALSALQYAADQGHALAQWKLGRMYAAGEGVPLNELRAFQYFSRIANTHAEDSPQHPQSRFVANAFVQLGHYYLDGIPDTQVKADRARAREMYAYAASYFGDADAQYSLAKLLLDGSSGVKDPKQALRWLNLAANKGQARAQALLGNVIFKGDGVPRQAARGLMWLTMAREGAASEKWVVEMYDAAFKQATDVERQMAVLYLESYMKGRRD